MRKVEEETAAERGAGRSEEGSLLRSGAVVSLMTMASRVLGLARDIVFAAIFGYGPEADAFFVAFKIPNFLRRLFAEGAFSQAFVPVLSEYRKTRSLGEVKRLVDHVCGGLGLVLVLVTLLGVLGSPLIARLFGIGYLDDAGQLGLLIDLLRLTFPYLLLISLTGFAGAILNSYGRFAVPALTPVFLNIALIGCALLLSPLLEEPVMALGWGVILAGFIQLLFQFPFLRQLGLFPRPRLDPAHEGVRKILALMVPVLFSVSVSQVNLMLDTTLATTLAVGSVSWLYYSDRLLELPLGIFGIAIATVILPSLSRIFAEQAHERFNAVLDWALRLIVLMGVPATVALIVLAEPIVITLYQRGEFAAPSVAPTVASMRAYALGLLGFMAIKVLASAWFSRQDTRTPVRCGVIALVSNMVLNLLFILPLAHVGLALATSLSAFVNAGLLLKGLRKLGVFAFGRHWLPFVLRVGAANGVMAALLLWAADEGGAWLAWGDWERAWHLGLLCCLGAAAYGLTLLATGVRPAHFRH